MRSIPNFKELKLYHQIHPIKLGTDIASAIGFLFFLWCHRIAPALVAGFLPPIIVSGVMMIWPPNVENVKNSPLGKYVSKYMTPTIEVVRLLTLVPMAWGAWTHRIWLIMLGFVMLLLAWCNGLIWPQHIVQAGRDGQLLRDHRFTGFACSDGTRVFEPVNILVVEVDGNDPALFPRVGSMTFRSWFSDASGALLGVGLAPSPKPLEPRLPARFEASA